MSCKEYLVAIKVMYGIIVTFGLIGNLIAFCIFGRMCNQNASTFLLRALAIVDSFFLVMYALRIVRGYFLSEIPWLYNQYIFFDVYVTASLQSIARTATVWAVVLIDAHCYIVVCKPLFAKRLCTVCNAKKHTWGVILLAVVVNVPSFFASKVQRTDYLQDRGINFMQYPTDLGASPWYQIGYHTVFLSTIINYAMPAGSLIFITVRLLQSLRSAKQRRFELSICQRQGQTDDARLQWMVIAVLVVFLICYIGYPIGVVFETLRASNVYKCDSTMYILLLVAHLMFLLNSSVNFIIYLLCNRNFRRTLCLCVKSVTGRQNNQRSPTLTPWT